MIRRYHFLYYLLYRVAPKQHYPHIFATSLICFFSFFVFLVLFPLGGLMVQPDFGILKPLSNYIALTAGASIIFNGWYFLTKHRYVEILQEFGNLSNKSLEKEKFMMLVYFTILLLLFAIGIMLMLGK